MINGVKIKILQTHIDARGFFRELIRSEDDIFSEGFGQLSHSLVRQGVVKAWHAHKIQTQWNYVVSGLIKVVLFDLREESSTYKEFIEFLAGEKQPAQVYCFPAGVLHGYKCIKGPMNIIYVTSGTYDVNEEIRIPQDSRDINYKLE